MVLHTASQWLTQGINQIFEFTKTYSQISNISRTKSQNLNVSRLVFAQSIEAMH